MRRRWAVVALAVLVQSVLAVGLVRARTAGVSTSGLHVVFGAKDRATGRWGIYTTVAGTDEIVRVTPDDGARYNWPTWVFNGTHILYTARFGEPGSAEEIYLMRADGTDVRQLTTTGWRNAQPMLSADERTVLFSSSWDEFKLVGLYSLDLASLQVTNLTAAGAPLGASDTDPRWAPDGAYVYARSIDDAARSVTTQIWTAGPDGVTGRRALVQDRFSNVDPEVSPDGGTVSFGSYRGPGTPARDLTDIDLLELVASGGDPRGFVKIEGWHLVTQDMDSGEQQVLTGGSQCDRPAADPCRPEEGAAFVPRWAPDGTVIGYVSARARGVVCICSVDRDGGEGRSVVERPDLDIDWFDWRPAPGAVPGSLGRIGTALPPDGLLFVGVEGVKGLAVSEPDRFGSQPLAVPDSLVPLGASWSADRRLVAFSARTPFDADRSEPAPPPPPGATRREHYTIDLPHLRADAPSDPKVAEEQIFLLDRITGRVRQLTTAWTEDYMDGARPDDPRANTDPSFSPDGKSVLFTNRSTVNSESFLLKMDLATGEVYSLTNATSGAVQVVDSGGRFSPDGRRVALSIGRGGASVIAVMGADGLGVRTVVDDDHLNLSPAWSPDGRSLVYSSYRGPADPADVAVASTGWRLVRVDIASGKQLELTPPGAPSAFRPVWSPDGSRIAFISSGPSVQPDLFVMPASGGPARPIQITHVTHEVSVDWR